MGGSCPLSLPSNAERRAHYSARVFNPANRKEERGRVSDLLSKLEQSSVQSSEEGLVQSMEEESLECTARFSIQSVGEESLDLHLPLSEIGGVSWRGLDGCVGYHSLG